jgi:hypothetical protein
MSAEMRFITGVPEEKKERFRKANKDLEAMEKKIEPFARHKKLRELSTEGKWGLDTC